MKMAAVCTSRSISSPNVINRCDTKEENECLYCYKLKQELDLTLQELSSAKKIIQMLQEDMNATPDHDAVSTGKANLSRDLNFETVNAKPRRKKLYLISAKITTYGSYNRLNPFP
jgi:hypothetical protein